ncbi:MAG: 30S ribosomal protein S9 [Candidatus Altiarchaeota archaeon]|nr:30S ribosomal protein S9 [Candidatus Altiarchaeota archaeon]
MVEKQIHKAGKRKMSIARATVKKGRGRVTINAVPLDVYQPEIARFKIYETLMLASDHVDLKKIDLSVSVRGGGVMGQADAIRSSIARGLVEFSGSDELLNAYISNDRTLIAGDHRLTEPHKPSQSSKGPRHKRQKSYR